MNKQLLISIDVFPDFTEADVPYFLQALQNVIPSWILAGNGQYEEAFHPKRIIVRDEDDNITEEIELE